MTTLEDLYYGNISPHERYIKRGTRVDKLVKLICKNEDELTAGLTEKQKETFEKFKDCTSEILGIKWSAIDFSEGDKGSISIRHKVVEESDGVVGYDVMKTKSSFCTLPLIPQVEQALLAEREKQEEMKRVMRRGYCKKYTDYICVDAIGELIKPNYVTDHFKVVLKEKGLKPVRFHDLRHSCASLLLANGVPMKMIQDWLGHSDMGITANIYSHIDSESKKASAMAIASALG